jgi:hypothetical protein
VAKPAELTIEAIKSAKTDERLLNMISDELERCLPRRPSEDIAAYVRAIRALPRGLRAMAATYDLDVSVTLDDLAWHFLNWYDRDLAEETRQGLIELEAHDFARWFEEAYAIISPFWDAMGSVRLGTGPDWGEWIEESGLKAQLAPLNDRFWEMFSAKPRRGIIELWVPYARKYPERLVPESVR